ncbi:hypothetical protein ACOSQ4_017499 [Xanthoceras sorbifolium]
MSENVETSGAKSIPVVIQLESGFNAGITLTESNYDVWSQLMEMHIAEREKLSYIRGKKVPPAESEDGYEKWYAENQKAFYDRSDELRVFTLNQKAFTVRQIGKTLSEYYRELTEIFHELDRRDKLIIKDADDIAAYRKSIERLRIHIFLAGLDGTLEQVRGEILRKDPILNLEECYALVRREAVLQTTLKGEYDTYDISAMGIFNLESESSIKQLPHRHTRGIPKPTYEPELSSKSFLNQLSIVSILSSVQEALADPKWKAAMNEEMKSLQKNKT